MKQIILSLLFFGFIGISQASQTRASKIIDAATATGTGSTFRPNGSMKTIQAVGKTTSGSGSAVVAIEVSDDCTNFMTLGTITLTLGTSYTSDGFVSDATWACVRGNVSTLSGTGKTVTVWIGN